MSTTEIPRGETGPRYLRLQVELVLEVSAAEELRAAALSHIGADASVPPQERGDAEAAVGKDESEALAYLVDPGAVVADVPGVALVQASWSCAHTEYDPAADSMTGAGGSGAGFDEDGRGDRDGDDWMDDLR